MKKIVSDELSQTVTAEDLEAILLAAGNPEKAIIGQRFFKTGPGQYGEGDIFIGLTNPIVRGFVKIYRHISLNAVEKLLQSPYHEVRNCGLLILVDQYERGDVEIRCKIYNLYLSHTLRINNWDLVDLSAPGIVGKHILKNDRTILYKLIKSDLLWDQRIAMVSTLTLIRNHEFSDTLCLAEMLMDHKHDLMHKATGWMLREIGKRDRSVLTAFLQKYKSVMPRTALRYAIEHYPDSERKDFLKK